MSTQIYAFIECEFFDTMLENENKKLEALDRTLNSMNRTAIDDMDIEPFTVAMKNHIQKMNDMFGEDLWKCSVKDDWTGRTIYIQTKNRDSGETEKIAHIELMQILEKEDPKIFEAMFEKAMKGGEE